MRSPSLSPPQHVSPPPCRLRSPRQASPRPLRWPSPPPLEFKGPNQELHITTIPGKDEWPDTSQVQPIALAYIPLPATWQTRLNEQVAYVPTAQRTRQITYANSYEELWLIFVTHASTVPEAFMRMYLSEDHNGLILPTGNDGVCPHKVNPCCDRGGLTHSQPIPHPPCCLRTTDPTHVGTMGIILEDFPHTGTMIRQ